MHIFLKITVPRGGLHHTLPSEEGVIHSTYIHTCTPQTYPARVYLSICIIYTNKNPWTSMDLYIYVYSIHLHVHTFINICMKILPHTYILLCTHTYIHTRVLLRISEPVSPIYVYIHTHIEICMYALNISLYVHISMRVVITHVYAYVLTKVHMHI